MNCRRLVLIIGLAFLVGSCADPLSSSNLAQVKGVLIVKNAGDPISGAVLRLWKVTDTSDGLEFTTAEHPVAETKTEQTGAFLFTDVPPGRYLLEGNGTVYLEDVALNLEKYAWSGIDVVAGQVVDLGVVEHCLHQHCGLPPTVTPTVAR